jgi:23S rRNA A2030 N6-methylase RlmJ
MREGVGDHRTNKRQQRRMLRESKRFVRRLFELVARTGIRQQSHFIGRHEVVKRRGERGIAFIDPPVEMPRNCTHEMRVAVSTGSDCRRRLPLSATN